MPYPPVTVTVNGSKASFVADIHTVSSIVHIWAAIGSSIMLIWATLDVSLLHPLPVKLSTAK